MTSKLQILKEWVARLRSGKYTQGKGHLQTADGKHCCLGVLSEMAVEAGVCIKTNVGDEALGPPRFGGSHWYLPPEVQAWAGIPERGPVIHAVPVECGVSFPQRVLAATLNDQGWTFKDIADGIEEHVIKPLEAQS